MAHVETISEPFLHRLKTLSPKGKVRAIVMLGTTETENATGRRQTRAERKAAIQVLQETATHALNELDDVLRQFDGKRLSEPNALGCVVVEATSAGVLAVAGSEFVKAVLEDQPIALIDEK